MNVISLFNGSIPLIALQVSAYVVGDEISLAFTKVIDRITIQNDEDEQAEVTDRDYWLKRSSKSMVELADKIHESVSNQIPGYSFKYNKFYIGLVKEGLAKNFISYRPMKKYMYLRIKGNEDQEVLDALDDVGLEATYENRWKRYSIKIASFDEFDKNQEYLMKLIQSAKEYLMGE